MAIGIMSVGILSMVVLYPLGLRESTMGQADLKQSIVADDLLNQAVAAASLTNFPWTVWKRDFVDQARNGTPTLPTFILNKMQLPTTLKPTQYRISCCRVQGASDKLMGIVVQSTDIENVTEYNQYSNNPIFYAEVLFQGDPTK